MSLNFQLKMKIYEKFYNQANFAQAVGADETVVSRVIRGRRKLNDEQQKRWASILGCEPSIFVDKRRLWKGDHWEA